tara:strand:+ start:494 stop:1120 length:627 start_codon:yes stop_codon:yes gene_type:complete
MSLHEKGYSVLKNAFSKDVCDIATQYALNDMMNHFSPSFYSEADPFCSLDGPTHCRYSDCMMESLLLHLTPKLEEHTNMKLIPTYSFYRVYKPGDYLKTHTDRPACEITVTVTLGIRYNDTPEGYKWDLYGHINDKKQHLECEVGDALLVKGLDIPHGRDTFEAGPFSYHVQVFLHYVDANGPYAEEQKYDRRTAIGLDPDCGYPKML